MSAITMTCSRSDRACCFGTCRPGGWPQWPHVTTVDSIHSSRHMLDGTARVISVGL